MNGENSFNPQPQTYWALLQSLAEQVGSEVFIKQPNTLYFGPEQSQGSLNVNYGARRGTNAENPGWGLKVDYNPRNNSNITVKTLSYDPNTAQTVNATAQATQTAVGKGRKPTALTGSGGKPQYPSSKHSGLGKVPAKSVYYIRCPGLSADQAQKRCQSMADNLAKHQIVLTCKIEGNLDVVMHSQVTLIESTTSLYGFGGIPLNVTEVSHSYDDSEGFTTEFRALAQIEASP